jgi:hypothetical protein
MRLLSKTLDESKLDQQYIQIDTSLPVYITMSTIPSRLQNTFRIIKHFLNHVQGIEKIILNIPWSYRRWPNFKIDVSNHGIDDQRFLLNRTNDYGPLTKFLPSLSIIPDNSITIICDDMCYNLLAFKDIAEKQDTFRSKAFSFYTYLYNDTVIIPQGADLISTYTRNVDNFLEWYNNLLKKLDIKNYFDTPCFFVDDQVIGWYFQYMGISLEQVERKHRNIYIQNCDFSPKKDNLNQQTGSNSRDNTMKGCFSDLKKTYPF